MKNIRLGLMGCGIVARHRHLPVIDKLPGIEKIALYTPRASIAEELASEFGFANAFSSEPDFWNAGLDLVSITSPAGCHLQNIRAAAEHHVDVLCEKPLALTDEDCQEIASIVDHSGIKLYVAFCFRFSPVSLKIRELITSGAIGRLKTMRLVFNWDCRGKYQDEEKKTLNERREKRMEEGGPLIDCGVHMIDLARFWSGSEPVQWCGHGSWADDYRAPDHVWVHLDHADGVHTMAEASFSYGHTCKNRLMEFRYDIIGTDGIIRYDHTPPFFELQNADGVQSFPYAVEKDFGPMYTALIDTLHTGDTGNMALCRDGVIATQIANAATQDALSKRLRPS